MSIESTETARKKRVGKLATIPDLIRECRRLYREGRNGDIDTMDMSRLAVLLKQMVEMMEASDIEKRIEALERTET